MLDRRAGVEFDQRFPHVRGVYCAAVLRDLHVEEQPVGLVERAALQLLGQCIERFDPYVELQHNARMRLKRAEQLRLHEPLVELLLVLKPLFERLDPVRVAGLHAHVCLEVPVCLSLLEVDLRV